MVGFGVSYKFLSSFNVWSRGTNKFSKAHHCANTNVGGNFHYDNYGLFKKNNKEAN